MIVHIQCFGQLRSLTKEAIVDIDVPNTSTLSEALNFYVKKYGEEMEKFRIKEGKIRSFYSIQVDKKNVEYENLESYIVLEKQTISIIPFVVGG